MDLLGEGIVRVAADTAPAENAMRRLAADFDRRMADMDRQRAEATVTADITALERKIVEAKAELTAMEREKAEVEIDGDTSGLDRAIKKAKLQLKELANEKARIQVDSKELRQANQEIARNTKLQQDNAKTTDAANRARARAIETARRESLANVQSARDLDRLRESYAKVYGERQRIEKQTGRPGGIFRTAGESRALKSTISEMDLLAHKIKALGGNVDDIDPDLERHQGILGRWATSISSVRLQLGFFSATLRQLGVGLIVFGPIIGGLVGGLTSLVGVLGSGLAGAGAVGAAGLAGFIASAVGVGLVIKPMVKDFGEAKKASEALTKAQLQYGKGSDQAKTAQEKFNQVMKGVSPEARQAFKDYGKLGQSWRDLTKAAKPAVFDAFGQGIKTVQALLPGFAKESVATTKTAAKAWDGWMKGLRSDEAKNLLQDTMEGFRRAIPGLADGLGSLAAAFGRISASAAKLLPDLSKGFADWADKIEASVGSGEELDDKVKNMVNNMRDLGHLAQDTGSFLTHFFGASSDAGNDLVNSLDRVIKRWDTWATSAGGQKSLRGFFAEAAQETKQFFAALAPLTQLLFQMTRAFAPVTSGMLDFVRIIGDVVQSISQLPGLSAGLKGLGAALAGIWAVGKIRSFSSAIGGAVTSLSRLAGLDMASGALGMLFGRGRKAPSGREFSTVATGAANAATGLTSASGAARVFSALLAPEVLIPVGAMAALVAFSLSLGDTESAFEKSGTAARNASKHMHQATTEFIADGERYNSTLHKQVSANDQAKQARERLIQSIQKTGYASKQTMRAQEAVTAAEQRQTQVAYQGARQRAQSVNTAREVLRGAKQEIKAREQQIHVAKEANEQIARGEGMNTAFGNPHEAEQVAFAVHKLSVARREAAAAAREMVVANIPLERQTKDLGPLTEQTVQGLRKLSATIGATATKKIGNFVNPKDVAQITNLSNKLTKLGRGAQVKQIDVRSRGAEQTTAKLQALQRQTAKVSGKTAQLNVKTNDRGAQQTLTRLSREAQRITGARNTIRILANSSNAEQAIARLKSSLNQTINKQYKAELKAEDKSGAARSAFNHGMQRAATGHYEAKLTAVDNASGTASKAKSNADKMARGQYRATLTATDQASSVIQGAIGQLNAFDGRTATSTITTVYKTVGHPPGHYAGGPAVYVPAFAAGGDQQQKMLDRAAEQAVVRQGNRSQVIKRPTMLTGEEAPRYNEYVIATNPAYKKSNERYLGAAASDLGYEMIPAYKKGGNNKGNNSNKGSNKGGNNGGGGNQQKSEPNWQLLLDKGPKKQQPSTPFYIRTKKFDKKDVNTINALEELISNRTSAYNILQDREEQEIRAHKRTSWDFGAFNHILDEKRDAFGQMTAAKGRVEKAAGNELKHASDALSGPLSAGNVQDAARTYNKADRSYSGMRKGKDETTAAYNKRKANAKRAKERAKLDYDHLKKERENAKNIAREAKEAIGEVREKRREAINEEAELRNEQTALSDIQNDPSLSPYYEPPEDSSDGGGGSGSGSSSEEDKPTLMDYAKAALTHAEVEHNVGAEIAGRQGVLAAAQAEYAAALGTADPRDDISAGAELKDAQEAVNAVTGAGAALGAVTGEQTAAYNSARQNLYQQFASNIAGNAGGFARGTLPYMPGSGGALAAGAPGGQPGGGSGTVNNVTNNFAAPPPDPHTWTKQQEFELGALG